MAGTAAAAIGLGDASRPSLQAQAREPSIDHTIRIGPISLELAPGKIVKTTGFNGTVPGPVLRLREGKPVALMSSMT
jgi:FtsP/CotA-like multicopper oxidase with cupredoxin domain